MYSVRGILMSKSIGEIDKNLKIETKLDLKDVRWYNVRSAPFTIYGLYNPQEPGYFRRMPTEIAEQVNDGVAHLHKHTSGGRVRFGTNSPYIAIKAVMPEGFHPMGHMTLTGSSGFDLYIVEDGEDVFRSSYVPAHGSVGGYESVLHLADGGMRDALIHFPLYDGFTELYIGLAEDAELDEGKRYKDCKPILYYGSSITQGGCASRPGNGYSNIVSRLLNVDHINLGFSGSARAEEIMVDYLATLDVSAFVCDYDHNAPNPEHLQATHKPLYERFRATHPDTPILFLTKPDIRPGNEYNSRRRAIVRKTYEDALAAGDKNVAFIDGETFFLGACRFDCTVDGCHPNDIGFLRMAIPVAEKLRELLGLN